MAKAHKVTGPLATPYLETGERIYLYEGAFLPSNLREGEADRLVELGLVSEVKVDDEKPTSVKDILADVGDDKGKAQEYLDEENAAEKPRPSLVEKLQAVLVKED